MESFRVQLINFRVLLKNVNISRKIYLRKYSSSTGVNQISDKYRVYCFGLSEHGALGLFRSSHTKLKRYFPRPIRHSFAEENSVCGISAGYGFSVFSVSSKDTFKVYGSGINTDFQLGNHVSEKNKILEILLRPVPVNLGLKCPETKVISTSAGRAHLAVLTDEEGVFLSGSNCHGQCGREILKEDKLMGCPYVNCIPCLGGEQITDVSCGQDHTIFITQSGKVWSCGWSCDGQTGLGHTETTYIPCRVTGDIENEEICKVACKSDCVLALSKKGEVFGWGNNEYLQLCNSTDIQQINSPMRLDQVNRLGKIIDIAAGASFCMALNECGDVFVWGYGILGGGPELQKSATPFNLPKTLFGWSEFQPETKVTNISCGTSHLTAINNCSHLFTWGRNRHGCLGIGHTRDQYFPYKVALSGLAVKASCGVDHTLVLCKPFT